MANEPKQKCKAEDILSPTVLELIKIAPQNETVRAHVHEEMKKAVPEEHKTTEAIIAWVEETYDPKFNFDTSKVLTISAFPTVIERGSAEYERMATLSVAINLTAVELVVMLRRANRKSVRWDKFLKLVGDHMYGKLIAEITKATTPDGKVDPEYISGKGYSCGDVTIANTSGVSFTVGPNNKPGAIQERIFGDSVYVLLEEIVPKELTEMTSKG